MMTFLFLIMEAMACRLSNAQVHRTGSTGVGVRFVSPSRPNLPHRHKLCLSKEGGLEPRYLKQHENFGVSSLATEVIKETK